MTRHVVLVGLMGSGKSSIGRIVAERTGRALLDSDEMLEARTGATAAVLAARDGVDELHRLEREVLCDALATDEPAVITAPASVAEAAGAVELLRPHRVAWMTADAATLATRVTTSDHRPWFGQTPHRTLRRQSATRDSFYSAVADVVVDSSELTPEEGAAKILRLVAPSS